MSQAQHPRQQDDPGAPPSVQPSPRSTHTGRSAEGAPHPSQGHVERSHRGSGSDPVGRPQQPSHDEIAMRAYFISIEQGADPLAAWLLAERELTTA